MKPGEGVWHPPPPNRRRLLDDREFARVLPVIRHFCEREGVTVELVRYALRGMNVRLSNAHKRRLGWIR